MAEKKYKGAPFGIQTARFDVSGIHPKSKTPGTFTQLPYDRRSMDESNRRLGPGKYDFDERGDFTEKNMKRKSSGPGWQRAHEVSRMAAMPHLLHKEQWELKKMLVRKLGPGTYNIKDFLDASDQKPKSTRGICNTKEARFKVMGKTEETPGPGTYGKGGIPHAILDEKEKKAASRVGMLDAGSSTPRTLPQVGSDLGPGSYQYNSFTDEMAKKLTSLRGPYDLFTGERNRPITTGHFAVPTGQNLGPGQYEIKSFVEDWDNKHKRKAGKFGKVAQYPEKSGDRIYFDHLSQVPRDPDDPGPGHYNAPDAIPKKSSYLVKSSDKNFGFLSSAQRNDRTAQKFFTRNFNPVGAGRYDIQKWEEAQHQNGHSSVFKSKTGRPNASQEKFMKERIREKDVPLEDRLFIVKPERQFDYVLKDKNTNLNRSLTVA